MSHKLRSLKDKRDVTHDYEFWEWQKRRLRQALLPGFEDAMQLGIEVGMEQTGTYGSNRKAAIGIDWDLVNIDALEWASLFTDGMLEQITQTTHRGVGAIIASWMESGDPFGALVDRLSDPSRFPYGKTRAQLIASTEVTRAYYQANLQTWKNSGVVDLHGWETAADDKVCVICAPLQGVTAKIGEEFEHPGGMGRYTPPAHPRCRCWAVPVVGEAAGVEQVGAEAGQPWQGARGRATTGENETLERLTNLLLEGLPPPGQDALLDQPLWAMGPEARADAKKQIVEALRVRSGADNSQINEFIRQWAETSNDADMRSLAMQRDAADLFGIELSDFTRGKIKDMEQRILKEIESLVVDQGLSREAANITVQGYADLFPLMPSTQQQGFLQAMYDNTQDMFAGAGFQAGDTVRLFRGASMPIEQVTGWGASVGDAVEVVGNPLESWSVSQRTARNFASGHGWGVVLEMDVPIEMVVGSARSGFGCLVEGEFVLIGGVPSQARIAWMATP